MPPRKPTGPVEKATPKNVTGWFRQWLTIKTEQDTLAKRLKELRDRLAGAIETQGYEDDKGNLFLDLAAPVDGYGILKYERRVTKTVNEDRATALVRKKKLEARCIVMVPTLDTEELMKAHYEDLITQEELDSIMDVSESFAFKQLRS